MPHYTAPLADIKFVLHEVIGVEKLTHLPGYADATADLYDTVLDEAAKFCEGELFPLNLSGDAEGCHYHDGVVTTPKGFRDAYAAYCAAGWGGLSAPTDYGGQGLPKTLNFMLEELICSANLSFGMYPGLTHGAINAILAHGNDAQKNTYLPKMISGEWSGTMCLTEPHCGTDLGLIKSRAIPNADGSYQITGTKIFISAGEHDLTENIIHLVLAKLPDAPAGTRGISLFVVPKFMPQPDGGLGARNAVRCGSIEHKMGIKASATCVMNFDGATGWLVGEPHKGMRAMFTMMNAARLGVGMQGLGIAEVSYQNALAYAKDRRQGRSLRGAVEADQPADPIIVHPEVRKNLLYMKAFTEGARALGCWVGYHLDVASHHPDAKQAQESDDLVALLTPIIKAYFTDMGSECANHAVQIFGGHGYIHEYGVEQYVRDARITQIYEGTNGIQALDLVGRKMPQDFGRLLRRFFHPVQAYLEQAAENPALVEFVGSYMKLFGRLQQVTGLIAQKGLANPDEAAAAATSYLRVFALAAMGYMWLQMADIAAKQLEAGVGDQKFYAAKVKTARFFFDKMLPETAAHLQMIMGGAKSIMDHRVDEF